MLKGLLLPALAGLLFSGCLLAQAQGTVLTFDQPQTAGMSSFRIFWDQPVVLAEDGAVADVDKGDFGKAPSAFWDPANKLRENGAKPGGLVFDAVHRSLLVRFPGSAQAIAAQMAKGAVVAKAEVILPFRATELWPEGYLEPAGMSFLGKQWANSKPRWHAIAWALRKPWVADPTIGPTLNAYINGAGYWGKYGAQDEKTDRYPEQLGPAEVSEAAPEGRLDITALLTDARYGATLAERLRKFDACGLLVRKWETYDAALWQGSYEWQTARGPQGILIHTPKLVITFAPGKATAIKAQDLVVDVPALAQRLKEKDAGGKPTAVLPTAEQLKQLATRLGFVKPAWMPDWQWQRVQELNKLGGGWQFPDTLDEYDKWLDGQLAFAPRRWAGFDATSSLETYNRYGDALPGPVKDHWKLYWTAWLMPDREAKDLVQGYIGGREAQEYYKKTGDWHGNFSVYRTYCYAMGTMNFNHWATAGTLLGGAIVGSPRLIADGRYGLEQWPLRTWCWFDGSTQESIDHYYFAHSLTAQKVFADYGPEHLDRMMGQSILSKSVEELASCYHPGLRRYIGSSGRTGIAYLLGIQDGLQAIIHTLSPEGAYTDFDKQTINAPNVAGMPAIGHDFQPGLAAQQTLSGSWAPDWIGNIVDGKPLPYELTVNYKQWGGFNDTPLWRRSYLGHNYGMASLDVAAGNETVPFMAQWRRADQKAASMTDLGTLIIRPGINRTELLDSIYHDNNQRNPNGSVGTQGMTMATLQHRNKAIVLASPIPKLDYPGGRPVPAEVRSLQVTVGLFNFEAKSTWELFVDGQPVTQFPAKLKYGQRIVVHDGVSYVGLIPIPATDLGRDTDVEIVDDGVMTEMQGGGKAREALRINAYIMKQAQPIDKATADWNAIDLAYGGYVVEMGDVQEWKDAQAFDKHLAEAKLETRWDAPAKTLNVSYRSGDDLLECGFKPDYGGSWNRNVPTDQCFPYRRVNGAWPYLPQGINRDSTLTQQGTTGKLEKNGAVLTCEPGKMAYLLTEPKSRSYIGMNPFPDPTASWDLRMPGGVEVGADGKVGLLRVVAQPAENRFRIDYAIRDEHKTLAGMATKLLIFGTKTVPTVELNGKAVKVTPETVTMGGRAAYVVPLNQGD